MIAAALGFAFSIFGWNAYVPEGADGWVSRWYFGAMVSFLSFLGGLLLSLGAFDSHRQE